MNRFIPRMTPARTAGCTRRTFLACAAALLAHAMLKFNVDSFDCARVVPDPLAKLTGNHKQMDYVRTCYKSAYIADQQAADGSHLLRHAVALDAAFLENRQNIAGEIDSSREHPSALWPAQRRFRRTRAGECTTGNARA